MQDDPITIDLLNRYLQDFIDKNVDTIILGCTHYPILKEQIQTIMGEKVNLIDSAESIGAHFASLNHNGNGAHQFYLTDTSEGFIDFAQRIVGSSNLNLKHLDL